MISRGCCEGPLHGLRGEAIKVYNVLLAMQISLECPEGFSRQFGWNVLNKWRLSHSQPQTQRVCEREIDSALRHLCALDVSISSGAVCFGLARMSSPWAGWSEHHFSSCVPASWTSSFCLLALIFHKSLKLAFWEPVSHSPFLPLWPWSSRFEIAMWILRSEVLTGPLLLFSGSS